MKREKQKSREKVPMIARVDNGPEVKMLQEQPQVHCLNDDR